MKWQRSILRARSKSTRFRGFSAFIDQQVAIEEEFRFYYVVSNEMFHLELFGNSTGNFLKASLYFWHVCTVSTVPVLAIHITYCSAIPLGEKTLPPETRDR